MVYLIREGSGERGMCFSALLVSQYLCHLEKYDEELLVFRESVFFFFFVFSDEILFGIRIPFSTSIFYFFYLRAPCSVLRAACCVMEKLAPQMNKQTLVFPPPCGNPPSSHVDQMSWLREMVPLGFTGPRWVVG